MSNEQGYNGYTNYETWAVCLWLDNDEGSQTEWAVHAAQCAERVREGEGNNFVEDPKRRAVCELAQMLKDEHDERAEEFMGNQSSVFADLINSSLSSVNWYEVAETRFDDDETFERADETEETGMFNGAIVSAQKHTQGPWQVGNFDNLCIFTCEENGPVKVAAAKAPNAAANAARIVACVNACENLTDDDLQGIAAHMRTLRADNERLRAALDNIAIQSLGQHMLAEVKAVAEYFGDLARAALKARA